MSNVNKKNRPQGYTKFTSLRKVIDFYISFDFVVEKMESLWPQVIRICRWGRSVLARQEPWISSIFWLVIFLILVGIFFIIQELTRSKSIGKTGKREGLRILRKVIDVYSYFDFVVEKMESLWPQVIRICRWGRSVLIKQEQWIPAIICLLILLVLIGIIFIIRHILKKTWIIQVKLYLYKMEGYLWQTNIHCWLQVWMCYYLPP